MATVQRRAARGVRLNLLRRIIGVVSSRRVWHASISLVAAYVRLFVAKVRLLAAVREFRTAKRRRDRAARIWRAPGWGLHRLAKWIVSPRVFENVLEPVLSDMQIEYQSALAEGKPCKAHWRQVAGYWRFWSHVGALVPVSVGRIVVALWRAIGS